MDREKISLDSTPGDSGTKSNGKAALVATAPLSEFISREDAERLNEIRNQAPEVYLANEEPERAGDNDGALEADAEEGVVRNNRSRRRGRRGRRNTTGSAPAANQDEDFSTRCTPLSREFAKLSARVLEISDSIDRNSSDWQQYLEWSNIISEEVRRGIKSNKFKGLPKLVQRLEQAAAERAKTSQISTEPALDSPSSSPAAEPTAHLPGTDEGREYWAQAGVVGFGDHREETAGERFWRESGVVGFGDTGKSESFSNEASNDSSPRAKLQELRGIVNARKREYAEAKSSLDVAQQKLLEVRKKLTFSQRVGKLLGTGADEYQKVLKEYNEKQQVFFASAGHLHKAMGDFVDTYKTEKESSAINATREVLDKTPHQSSEKVFQRLETISKNYNAIYFRALESDDMWLEKQREAQEAVPPKGTLLRAMQKVGQWYGSQSKFVRYGVVPVLGATAGSMLTGAAFSIAYSRRIIGMVAGSGVAAFVMHKGTDFVNRREALQVRKAKESFAFTNAQATLEKLRDARLKAASGKKWTRYATLATGFGLGMSTTMLLDLSDAQVAQTWTNDTAKSFLSRFFTDDTVPGGTKPIPMSSPQAAEVPISATVPGVVPATGTDVYGAVESDPTEIKKWWSKHRAVFGEAGEASDSTTTAQHMTDLTPRESTNSGGANPATVMAENEYQLEFDKLIRDDSAFHIEPASQTTVITGTYEQGSSIAHEIDQWLAKEKPDLSKEVRQGVAWRITEEQIARAKADPAYAKGLGIMSGDPNLVARSGTYTMELPKGAPLQAHIDRVLEVRGSETGGVASATEVGSTERSSAVAAEPAKGNRLADHYKRRGTPLIESTFREGMYRYQELFGNVTHDSRLAHGLLPHASRLLQSNIGNLSRVPVSFINDSEPGASIIIESRRVYIPRDVELVARKFLSNVGKAYGEGVLQPDVSGDAAPTFGEVLERVHKAQLNEQALAGKTAGEGAREAYAVDPTQSSGSARLEVHLPRPGENRFGFNNLDATQARLSSRIGSLVGSGALSKDGWLTLRGLPIAELRPGEPGYVSRALVEGGIPQNDIVATRGLLRELMMRYQSSHRGQLLTYTQGETVQGYMTRLVRGIEGSRQVVNTQTMRIRVGR